MQDPKGAGDASMTENEAQTMRDHDHLEDKGRKEQRGEEREREMKQNLPNHAS